MDPVLEEREDDSGKSNDFQVTLTPDKDGALRVSSVDTPEKNVGAYDAVDPGYSTMKSQYAYLRFVLNPDREQPVRMPSQLSYPSALLQFNQNFTLTLPQGDFCAFFAPQNSLINTNG